MYLWWSLCTLYLHLCQVRVTVNVPLVEFMYLVFTRMPGKSYCRRLRYLLLCLCDILRTLINFLVCSFCNQASVFTFHLTTLQLTEGSHFVSMDLPEGMHRVDATEARKVMKSQTHVRFTVTIPSLTSFSMLFYVRTDSTNC